MAELTRCYGLSKWKARGDTTTASKLNDSPDGSVGINRYFKTFPTIYIAGL